jgi:competence protein ComEC
MNFWNKYPLLRLLISFILGILIASFYPAMDFMVYALAGIMALLLFWVLRPKILINYSFRFVGGILISFLFFLFGYQLTVNEDARNDVNHYSRHTDIEYYIVRVNTPIIEKKKSFKTTGLILGGFRETDSLPVSLNGEVLIYLAKINELNLNYGDEILISAKKLNPIKNLGNPNEFDYATYLGRQNIYHQTWLNKSDWIKTGHATYIWIKRIGFQSRDYLLKILESFKFTNTEFAVISAILLGYDEYLDQETRAEYSGSGATHILCVSGLHVGIVFMIFSALLAPLRKLKKGEIFVPIIILLIIWFYALITGLSPSVLRSAAMFSFIAIGTLVKRKTSTFNSVFASALVLLIIHPNHLFHIGFQLSYLAVLSILLFQPDLSRLCKCKRGIAKKTFDLVAVSIAAQLGTFPLAIFYFHQFPNYFLLTNIFVIPVSFIILVAGIFALFVSVIGLSSTIVGFVAKQLLYYPLLLMNEFIEGISNLPYSVATNLFFTHLDTALVYLFIVLVFYAIFMRNAKLLSYSLVVMGVIQITNIALRYQSSTVESLCIYNVPKYSLIQLNYGTKTFIIGDTALLNHDKEHYYISGYQTANRIKIKEKLSFQDLNNSRNVRSFVFKEQSFFIVDEDLMIPTQTTSFDYVLLRNSPKIKLEELLKRIDADYMIADGSNKYWKIEQWKKECEVLKIPLHDLTQQGAFIIK